MINLVDRKEDLKIKNDKYKTKLDKIREQNITIATIDDLISLLAFLEIEAIITRPLMGCNNNNLYIILEKGEIESFYMLKKILKNNSSYNYILIYQ